MTKEEALQKLQFEASIRGLSKSTQDGYYIEVKQFQNHYDKAATELTVEDIKNFLYYQLTVKGLAPSSVNKQNSALKFLYNVALISTQLSSGLGSLKVKSNDLPRFKSSNVFSYPESVGCELKT